jgi:hypothetical protein
LPQKSAPPTAETCKQAAASGVAHLQRAEQRLHVLDEVLDVLNGEALALHLEYRRARSNHALLL